MYHYKCYLNSGEQINKAFWMKYKFYWGKVKYKHKRTAWKYREAIWEGSQENYLRCSLTKGFFVEIMLQTKFKLWKRSSYVTIRAQKKKKKKKNKRPKYNKSGKCKTPRTHTHTHLSESQSLNLELPERIKHWTSLSGPRDILLYRESFTKAGMSLSLL